jgi:sporulation protein YlmC with PRC-barrel domain
MNLAHEVLDKQIVGRRGRKIGKVDDLLLEIGPDGRARVVAIITGHGALAPILGSGTARLIARLRGWLLGRPMDTPHQIGWEHVQRIDVVVRVDLDREEADLVDTQHALWERWIKRLPFAER